MKGRINTINPPQLILPPEASPWQAPYARWRDFIRRVPLAIRPCQRQMHSAFRCKRQLAVAIAEKKRGGDQGELLSPLSPPPFQICGL